ncbi:MAG: Gfo/Idh/MocA family protein [Planctomycetaceae bacterium]
MSPQTRRDFLEHSLFAAAAAAAAGNVAAPVQAEDKQSNSPNERLRVAVVGVRGRGGEHLQEFTRRSDTEVAAIVDVDEAVGKGRVRDVEKKTGKAPTWYKDIRVALEDKTIDVITVATPNHWHSLAAIWAIQHGKDVYLEKPVSHNVSEGRRVVQAARKHKKIVQTGTQCRSSVGLIDAIAFLKSGGIGKVNLARGLCYKGRPSIGPRGTYEVPASVDYDIWSGPAQILPLTRPKFHYDWHWQWEYGNGDLGNQGIHQMDIARWGLGVDDLGSSVFSYGGRLGYEDAGETANTQVSVHDYGEKRLVFEVRGLPTAPLEGAAVGVIFYGTEGYMVIPSYSDASVFDLDKKLVKKFSGSGNHFGNFVNAVRSRKQEELNADILQGHISSALCHLGNISYRLGEVLTGEEVAERVQGDKENQETLVRVKDHLTENKVSIDGQKTVRFGKLLKIDPKAEVFTGEGADEANPMLTREYRAPYVVPEEKDV